MTKEEILEHAHKAMDYCETFYIPVEPKGAFNDFYIVFKCDKIYDITDAEVEIERATAFYGIDAYAIVHSRYLHQHISECKNCNAEHEARMLKLYGSIGY